MPSSSASASPASPPTTSAGAASVWYCADDSPQRLSAFSGAAADGQADSAVVRRIGRGVDHLHAVLPDGAAGRVRLRALASRTARPRAGDMDSSRAAGGERAPAADYSRRSLEAGRTASIPLWRILGLLAVTVGGPYFLLSSTSPLLQSWYSRSRAAGVPYRFFALSNFGLDAGAGHLSVCDRAADRAAAPSLDLVGRIRAIRHPLLPAGRRCAGAGRGSGRSGDGRRRRTGSCASSGCCWPLARRVCCWR